MIYTVGNPETYEPLIDEREAEGGCVRKLGASEDYEGGTVCQTEKDARRVADEYGYEVYGVEANWERDTSGTGPVRHLLTTSPIRRL